MAFRKTLAHRFLHKAKVYSSQIRAAPIRKLLPDSGEEPGLLRRFLQKRQIFQPALPPDRFSLPIGDKLIERIRILNGDRIRLDGLTPPPRSEEKEEEDGVEREISMEEVRKVLRASQMEMVRSRLRTIEKSCITYYEFVQICCDISNIEQGLGLARSLDESGAVIVLGNVVFLRPDQELK